MNKHTPGPWKVVPPLDEPGDEDWQISAPTWIALAVGFNNDDAPGEGEANARLIAKAPEMLKVLDSLIASDKPTNTLGEVAVAYDEAVARARALLEEVEGDG